MATKIVKKAAPAAGVAAQAQAAVEQAQTTKAPRKPPAPQGFTTETGPQDKRIPFTLEEITAALKGKPAGVHLVPREWRSKTHYSIVAWNGTSVVATRGGCFEVERARGFQHQNARSLSLNIVDDATGEARAPNPARARAEPAAEGEATEEAEAETEAAPAAPATGTKKVVVKKAA